MTFFLAFYHLNITFLFLLYIDSRGRQEAEKEKSGDEAAGHNMQKCINNTRFQNSKFLCVCVCVVCARAHTCVDACVHVWTDGRKGVVRGETV